MPYSGVAWGGGCSKSLPAEREGKGRSVTSCLQLDEYSLDWLVLFPLSTAGDMHSVRGGCLKEQRKHGAGRMEESQGRPISQARAQNIVPLMGSTHHIGLYPPLTCPDLKGVESGAAMEGSGREGGLGEARQSGWLLFQREERSFGMT
jgi:hypothetical protein